MDQFLGNHMLHLRLTDQGGGIGWLRSVGEHLRSDSRLIRIVGAIETGVNGQLHWQLTIEATIGHQALAVSLKKKYPELKGEASVKGQKYSCTVIRSNFSRSAGYCLKELDLPIDQSDDRLIMKGVSIDYIEELKGTFPKDVFGESKTYIGKVTEACRGCSDRKEICRRLIEWHLSNDRTIPNKYKRGELVDTIRCRISGDYEDPIDELVDETVY